MYLKFEFKIMAFWDEAGEGGGIFPKLTKLISLHNVSCRHEKLYY
jgi:hypothetical protein